MESTLHYSTLLYTIYRHTDPRRLAVTTHWSFNDAQEREPPAVWPRLPVMGEADNVMGSLPPPPPLTPAAGIFLFLFLFFYILGTERERERDWLVGGPRGLGARDYDVVGMDQDLEQHKS